MNSTYYTSLSGMAAASYGLQNTSNNVANMQSPGFKRNDVFYSSLGHGGGGDGLGSGVYVGGQSINFADGQYLETGNPSDLAIVGNGFFIVRMKNGELLYTRDGEFGFNTEGLLIDRHSQGLVQGYDARGNLVPIHQFGSAVYPGKPTHAIDLKGELIIRELEKDLPGPADPDPFKSKYEHIKFSIGSVFDNEGREHSINLEFESPGMPGTGSNTLDNLRWNLLSATSEDMSVTFDPQSIEFDSMSSGTPRQGSNTIVLKLKDGQKVTLNFGDYTKDSDSSVRIYNKDQTSHVNTSIEVKKQDGYRFGRQTGFSFDDNGQISYLYDNGKSEDGAHVALALFDDPGQSLVQAHDNLFRASHQNGRHIGQANKQNFGCIQPKKLESSNVDSTREFANIVVLQRMFQACSQIMDIDKQLLEALYK